MIWGWVNDDRIFILRQVITLKSKKIKLYIYIYIYIYIIYITHTHARTHAHTHTHTHTHTLDTSTFTHSDALPSHFYCVARTLTHICRIRAFILPLGIWLFRGAVSTSLPWSATSSSSDLSTLAAGLWAQQNQPKEQGTTINNGILRELCNTRRIRSWGGDFRMENNALCLVFAFWLICIWKSGGSGW